MQNTTLSTLIGAVILSVGIMVGSYFIAKGVYQAKLSNRSVTVKGIAERNVKADLGIWEIDYREVGNSLVKLNEQLAHDQQVVIQFLEQQGFTREEMEIQPVKLSDKLANVYAPSDNINSNLNTQRYVIIGGVRVRSKQVDLISKTSQLLGTLLQQNIPLAFDAVVIYPNPSYYFTTLDAIRPEMLAEATKSARLVAEQFAKDSNSKLGDIQRANQGIFQVMGRDNDTSADMQTTLGAIDKKVRLVTTLEYRLRSEH